MSYRFALPEAVRLRMDEKNAVRQQPVINACLRARDAAAGCLLASVLLAASAAMDSLSLLSAISTDYFLYINNTRYGFELKSLAFYRLR